MDPQPWSQLEARSREIVEKAISELPAEIRNIAREIPSLFEERCEDDPEILGIYADFAPGEISEANGPIILYLRAIEEYCLEEGEDFAAEVRLTYLHELGHHFGWDEGDLGARGLA